MLVSTELTGNELEEVGLRIAQWKPWKPIKTFRVTGVPGEETNEHFLCYFRNNGLHVSLMSIIAGEKISYPIPTRPENSHGELVLAARELGLQAEELKNLIINTRPA